MKKKVLILGGYGFMGKNLNRVFRKDSRYEIFNESRETGCDLRNLSSLIRTLQRIDPDIIIYAAAHVGSLHYVSQYAAEVVHDNSLMYINLYKAVADVNRNIVIINPISNCSYPGIIDIQHEELWWQGAIHPSVEAYGTPKKLGYIISKCYRKEYGIRTVNLIVPNAYGENDYVDSQRVHAMNGIIMRMLDSQRRGEKTFTVWGTGSPVREWVYMPDIARLFKHIIDEENYDLPDPLNVGQEQGISIGETAQVIKDLLNYEVDIIFDTTKQDGAPIKILGKKAFSECFPNFKFTEYTTGISNTIQYYKDSFKFAEMNALNQAVLKNWERDKGNHTLAIDYPLHKDSIVLDLGGYTGQWAEKIINRYDPYVILVEPISAFSNQLRSKFAHNKKVSVLQAGVSSYAHTGTLYVKDDSTSAHVQGSRQETVNFLEIETILEWGNIEEVDLLQINIEGEEYDLLEKIGDSETIKRFKNIQIQFHTFIENCEERREKIQALLSKNFNKKYEYPFVFEAWTRK